LITAQNDTGLWHTGHLRFMLEGNPEAQLAGGSGSDGLGVIVFAE
jgi:hypothetical protein